MSRTEYMRAWRAANKEKAQAHTRKASRKRRGMVDPTGETKTGPCEICGLDKPLHLDHSHTTGKIRGWLCFVCNTRLAKIEDANWLSKATKYLEGR